MNRENNGVSGGKKTPRLLWIVGPILLFLLLNTALSNAYASFLFTFFIFLVAVLVVPGGKKRRSGSQRTEERTMKTTGERPAKKSKAGRVIAIAVAAYTAFNLFLSLIGLGMATGSFSALLTFFVLAVIGVTICLVVGRVLKSRKEDFAAGPAVSAKAEQRSRPRPEGKAVTCAAGESHRRTVGEDCFVLPPRDRATRRREQLETLYHAGLYTREEYAAERAKLRRAYDL